MRVQDLAKKYKIGKQEFLEVLERNIGIKGKRTVSALSGDEIAKIEAYIEGKIKEKISAQKQKEQKEKKAEEKKAELKKREAAEKEAKAEKVEIKELDDTDEIPIYERFFGGGIGTVRGYEERSLGPRDAISDDPVGGCSLFAKNFELIYPLYQDILRGVLFFDAGNVWENWGKFGSLRKSVGAGVKVIVPILNAPIEIYYGHALDREDDEPESQWHFGMTFGF